MHIRIINPTVTHSWAEDSRLAYASVAGPGTEVSMVTLDWGTASIESARDQALVTPDIMIKAMEAEREGADAVIIDCMGDPGLYAVRELVRIPVVGPAEASMHLAAQMGHRFSVLTVFDSRIPMMEEEVVRYGLYPRLASVRGFNIPVLELEQDWERTIIKVTDVAERAVREDGAHVIIPGCTGLAGLASRIQKGLAERSCEVPVLDPPAVAMKLAESLVALGLAQSRRTFAAPHAKEIRLPGKMAYGTSN